MLPNKSRNAATQQMTNSSNWPSMAKQTLSLVVMMIWRSWIHSGKSVSSPLVNLPKPTYNQENIHPSSFWFHSYTRTPQTPRISLPRFVRKEIGCLIDARFLVYSPSLARSFSITLSSSFLNSERVGSTSAQALIHLIPTVTHPCRETVFPYSLITASWDL